MAKRGCPIGAVRSPETRARMSEAQRRARTPEVRERMAAAQRGKRKPPEVCAKIAAGNRIGFTSQMHATVLAMLAERRPLLAISDRIGVSVPCLSRYMREHSIAPAFRRRPSKLQVSA